MQFLLPKSVNATKFVERRSTLVLLCFLALSAITLSAWQSFSYFLSQKERTVLVQNAINNGLANLRERAAGQLAGTVASLHILAGSPTLQHFADATKRDNDIANDLTRLFVSLIESNSMVFQIRYLGPDGHEKLRVNKVAESPVVVPETELQDKSQRSYFTEVKMAPPGQLYVSALDLNVEHNQVEQPWRPTIRLAVAVYDRAAQFTGALVVNIDIKDIIGLYHATDSAARVDVMLVNDDGYWLYGQPQEDLWGFMFGHDDATITTTLPEVWSHIVRRDANAFKIKGDGWTFLTTKVADLFPKSLAYVHADRVLWHAVVKNPPQPIIASLTGYIPSLVILIALIAFGWAWVSNVAERRRAERELVKSEKMSSLGGLVAGVAHELNTPIGSAVTIASTMQDQAHALFTAFEKGQINKSHIVEFVDGVRHGTSVVLRGLNRAIELIGHFKQIAVDQSGEQRRTFDLDNYIEEMSATFQHLFRHRRVGLELDLRAGVVLDTYPGPLSQVVINLVQNALLHGFNEEESGTIRISSRCVDGSRVTLVVSDTGHGIPPDIIDRVFEPFFTTKLGQGGSGLGLHIVYNIVTEALGGEIAVVSDTQKHFTQFTIVLPLKNARPLSATPIGEDYVQRNAA